MFALIAGRNNVLELCDQAFQPLTGAESFRIEFSKCGEQKRILDIATSPTKCNDVLKFPITVGCDQDVELTVGLWQFELYVDGENLFAGNVMVNKIVTSLNELECKT